MNELRKIPATLILIVVNTIVFGVCYLIIGTFGQPFWTLGQLKLGALFNPFTLDDESYRIFTSMFLHGHLPHLIMNMYGLYAVGSQLETLVGAKKMLAVYFLSGIAAALSSLYFNLFVIGVGASGAIFGLFGFAIIVTVFLSRRQGRSLTPVIINFAVFLGINILLAEAFNADNAAHFGGLACGVVVGLTSMFTRLPFIKLHIEYVILTLLITTFFFLPRYQVEYFKVFNRVFEIEEHIGADLAANHTDSEYRTIFSSHESQWDSTASALDQIKPIPSALSQDTFNLRRYIALRKLESTYRRKMVEKESYVYFDSIDFVRDTIAAHSKFDHKILMRAPQQIDTTQQQPKYKMAKVWYDHDWIEVDGTGAYYRIGYKDSLGMWQDVAYDFFKDGTIQIKGKYKDDKKNGVFLYYSDHNTYTSAGRYVDDLNVGKWEEYYWNGQLKSESYFNNAFYMQNVYDSTGHQIVANGHGTAKFFHANGQVAEEGDYVEGKKHGYWYGRHPTGEMYFEENYNRGRLVNGRSRGLDGKTAIYDEATFFPIPAGGQNALDKYLHDHAIAAEYADKEVRVTFRVTRTGRIADFIFEDAVEPALREKTKQLILRGPQWIPARLHGQEPIDGTAFVRLNFHP
jgi:membrane associated rhomboid family serine protease/antitoxin component YwqK of YwqJK toxin-antitoxin module